jgi:hypothetical protein
LLKCTGVDCITAHAIVAKDHHNTRKSVARSIVSDLRISHIAAYIAKWGNSMKQLLILPGEHDIMGAINGISGNQRLSATAFSAADGGNHAQWQNQAPSDRS